jgi:hypothetical protein
VEGVALVGDLGGNSIVISKHVERDPEGRDSLSSGFFFFYRAEALQVLTQVDDR